jgi:hypothetical protein
LSLLLILFQAVQLQNKALPLLVVDGNAQVCCGPEPCLELPPFKPPLVRAQTRDSATLVSMGCAYVPAASGYEVSLVWSDEVSTVAHGLQGAFLTACRLVHAAYAFAELFEAG